MKISSTIDQGGGPMRAAYSVLREGPPPTTRWKRGLALAALVMLVIIVIGVGSGGGGLRTPDVVAVDDGDGDVPTIHGADNPDELLQDDGLSYGNEEISSTTQQPELNENTNEQPKEHSSCSAHRRGKRPGIIGGLRAQYVHVPKAGGTSIQIALAEWARRSTSDYPVNYFAFNGLTVAGSRDRCPAGAMSHSLVAGHRGFGFCAGFSSEPFFSFTAIREPIAHFLSLYDYNLKTRQTTLALTLFGKKSISELIKRYESTPELEKGENVLKYAASQQTRFICGYDCFAPPGFKYTTPTDEEMLVKAKQNLLKFDALAVSEHLNDLIYQLRFQMPHVIPADYHSFPHSNTIHVGHSVLDDEALAIVKRWARVDLELYAMASEIAKKKTAQAHACLKEIHDGR